MKKIFLFCICVVLYIAIMYTVSSTQTYERVMLDASGDFYEVTTAETEAFSVELHINNESNLAVSSQLEDCISYSIYRVHDGEEAYLGKNILADSIGNILPDTSKTVICGVYIPPEKGTYKLVFDIDRGDSFCLSSKGMDALEINVEVK